MYVSYVGPSYETVKATGPGIIGIAILTATTPVYGTTAITVYILTRPVTPSVRQGRSHLWRSVPGTTATSTAVCLKHPLGCSPTKKGWEKTEPAPLLTTDNSYATSAVETNASL